MTELLGWRLAACDTPFWVQPNREGRRFNAPGQGPVQYWSLHPLTPWAEYLRAQGIRDAARLRGLRVRLWVGRLSADPVTIGFADAGRHALQPEDLVADDHGPCQAFAARCLGGAGPAVIEVPSAALPGTTNLIVFGPRVAIPYSVEPVDAVDAPATVSAEDGHAPDTLLPLVRHVGEPHAELAAWAAHRPFRFAEPATPLALPS